MSNNSKLNFNTKISSKSYKKLNFNSLFNLPQNFSNKFNNIDGENTDKYDYAVDEKTENMERAKIIDEARKEAEEFVNDNKTKKNISETTNTVKEQLGNGPTEYRSWFYGHDNENVDWCTIFVNWIFNHNGESNLYVMPSEDSGLAGEGIVESVKAGYGTWYESEYNDSSTTPQEGDVVCFNWVKKDSAGNYDENAPWGYDEEGNKKNWKYITPQGSDHVGYVYKVDDDYIYTIEGNTGSMDPDLSSVQEKKYKRDDIEINGYYRPNYENAIN